MSDEPSKLVGADLYDEANKFRGYASVFTVLTALGSLGIGWLVSRRTTCGTFLSDFSCTTETDEVAFMIGALASFVGGMLFVLPLKAAASILTGVAVLVEGRSSAGTD